jgi:CheY-like chemotaxis protein/nitrogen-specific signal transduction histidine kinase
MEDALAARRAEQRENEERRRIEEAFRQADRRKDEFLAILAHELRNPLAPLFNSLQLLRLGEDLSPVAQSVRDVMERQVQHLIRLVDDLLEISRISRGKIELRKQAVDVCSVIATAIETSRPLIDAGRHELTVSLPPEPIVVDADPVRLSQVLANLLNNAARYTPVGGQIWVTAACRGDAIVISVRDTGVGIPPALQDRVFEMFARAEHSVVRAHGGLGIGLALAKAFVELHEGRITVRSAGENLGSEFVITLPLAPVQRREEPPPASDGRPAPCSCRILVVDDSRAAANTLKSLLELLGHQVHTAYDAASAVESARRVRPQLVISDIGMPEVDGYELARRLRQTPGLEEVVLVALTGYGQKRDIELASAAGFDWHVVKPITLAGIQGALQLLPTARSHAS